MRNEAMLESLILSLLTLASLILMLAFLFTGHPNQASACAVLMTAFNAANTFRLIE